MCLRDAHFCCARRVMPLQCGAVTEDDSGGRPRQYLTWHLSCRARHVVPGMSYQDVFPCAPNPEPGCRIRSRAHTHVHMHMSAHASTHIFLQAGNLCTRRVLLSQKQKLLLLQLQLLPQQWPQQSCTARLSSGLEPGRHPCPTAMSGGDPVVLAHAAALDSQKPNAPCRSGGPLGFPLKEMRLCWTCCLGISVPGALIVAGLPVPSYRPLRPTTTLRQTAPHNCNPNLAAAAQACNAALHSLPVHFSTARRGSGTGAPLSALPSSHISPALYSPFPWTWH